MAFGADAKQATLTNPSAKFPPVFVKRNPCIFVIIEPGPAHFFIFQIESKGLYQVQLGARISSQTYDISRIWGYFRLKKDDVDQYLTTEYVRCVFGSALMA